MRFWSRLPAITIGIAIAKPLAVVLRATAISDANASALTPVSPAEAILPNAAIMPTTVPSRPNMGAVLTIVATQLDRYSRSASTCRSNRSATVRRNRPGGR